MVGSPFEILFWFLKIKNPPSLCFLKHTECGLSVFLLSEDRILNLGIHKRRADLDKIIKAIKILFRHRICSSFWIDEPIIRPILRFVNSFFKKNNHFFKKDYVDRGGTILFGAQLFAVSN